MSYIIMLALCQLQDRRGVQQELVYMDQSRVLVKYVLPLSEVVIDFNDQVKSLSSGYARSVCRYHPNTLLHKTDAATKSSKFQNV